MNIPTTIHGYFTSALVATRRTRVALRDCPPGLFECHATVGLKTQYGECYIASNGDAFWGGTSTEEARGRLKVLPLKQVFEAPRKIATAPKDFAPCPA